MIDRSAVPSTLWKWLHSSVRHPDEWTREDRMQKIDVQDGDTPELGALAKRALRDALHESRSADGVAQVRLSLERLCSAARESDVRAERLLILLKLAWRDLCDARTAAHEHDGTTLSRVITLCIKEYYGAPPRT